MIEREKTTRFSFSLSFSLSAIDLRASNSRTPPPPPRGSQKKKAGGEELFTEKTKYYLGFVIFRVATKKSGEAKVCFREGESLPSAALPKPRARLRTHKTERNHRNERSLSSDSPALSSCLLLLLGFSVVAVSRATARRRSRLLLCNKMPLKEGVVLPFPRGEDAETTTETKRSPPPAETETKTKTKKKRSNDDSKRRSKRRERF